MNAIKDLLLIENDQVFLLYKEFLNISLKMIAPCFLIGICLEYLGNMQFLEVIKKIVIIVIFMNFFYSIHKEIVASSFEIANSTIKRISPNNLFLKPLASKKLNTKYSFKNILDGSFLYADIVNDIVSEIMYVLCHIFLWLLKLIYSTVYHFTYLFSSVAALLYFFKWTDRTIVGTFQSSLWCVLMPFFVIAIFILVSNTLSLQSIHGHSPSFKELVWLFGVCLLLLMSPMIVFAFVRGDGVASFGAQFGQSIVKAGMTTMALTPLYMKRGVGAAKFLKSGAGQLKDRFSGSLAKFNNASPTFSSPKDSQVFKGNSNFSKPLSKTNNLKDISKDHLRSAINKDSMSTSKFPMNYRKVNSLGKSQLSSGKSLNITNGKDETKPLNISKFRDQQRNFKKLNAGSLSKRNSSVKANPIKKKNIISLSNSKTPIVKRIISNDSINKSNVFKPYKRQGAINGRITRSAVQRAPFKNSKRFKKI